MKILVSGLVLCSSVLLDSAVGVSARLSGNLGHEYQRVNNCGPVTAKMALSLLGIRVTQLQAAATLKENGLDRNVSVNEVARYLERFGLIGWLERVCRREFCTFPLLHGTQIGNLSY